LIPYYSVILHSIFLTEDSLPTFVETPKDCIDWIKMSRLGGFIWKLRKYYVGRGRGTRRVILPFWESPIFVVGQDV
jgi:hypothetical protein